MSQIKITDATFVPGILQGTPNCSHTQRDTETGYLVETALEILEKNMLNQHEITRKFNKHFVKV